jgi:hypothetical protein
MKFERIIPKPFADEYPAYSAVYMELVPDDGMVLQHLYDNFIKIKAFIRQLPDDKLHYR